MTKETDSTTYIEKNSEQYDQLANRISQPGGREHLQELAEKYGTIETPKGNILPKLPPEK